MKKKKLLSKDKELKEQLKNGRESGEKDFYSLLKKASQPLDERNSSKK